jgi:hypothetical protein
VLVKGREGTAAEVVSKEGRTRKGKSGAKYNGQQGAINVLAGQKKLRQKEN